MLGATKLRSMVTKVEAFLPINQMNIQTGGYVKSREQLKT